MNTVYDNDYHVRTKDEPQLYNDWLITDDDVREEALYIVEKLKDKLLYPDKDIKVPYIDKNMVHYIAIELIEDGSFTVDYIYDFICEHWSRIENGKALGVLANYLEQCHYYEKNIRATLKRRLKKQADNKGYITIYRGFNGHNREDGNSFTLSLNKAIWFARRYNTEVCYVNTYKIHIDSVLAFITNKNEAEIIANPDCLILLETKNDFWRKKRSEK